MTMQEFITANDSKGFFDDHLKKLRFHFELSCSSKVDGDFEKSRAHLRRADNSYYILYGYINAVYAYGHISFEDQSSLVNELMELFESKK